ncbi:hypothetical protein CBR_g30222 [Chara braunii]|uniref:Pentacotripeptide-repeat region of PRORP domain-containing protein n=1 Tax=Chara braunii TaxID=69332 RepID=A0A388LCD0_CHABU|nr:hypothetical protein CBR_g30222 [Chara braunii]|eukprot:GBG79960.1 hypothetical protein CBR_g30222 [Chara braunii]
MVRGLCRSTAWGVEELGAQHGVSKSLAFLRPSLASLVSSRRWSDASVQVELEKDESSSGAQKVHNDIWEVLGKGQLPSRQRFHAMLQQCSTPDDLDVAFMTTERLRVIRAARRQMSNFGPGTSLLLMRACIRAGDLERAMTVLYRFNVWGLTPSLEAAHELLVHVARKGDLKMVQKVLRIMAKNGIYPVPETASIITRAFTGNFPAAMKIAVEFEVNGVPLYPKTIDRCMMTSASYGNAQHVMELQKVREKRGVPASIKSGLALAQAHLLLGNVEQAANLIESFNMDRKKLDHAIEKMVKRWPAYLQHYAAQGSTTQASLLELEKNLSALVEQLRSRNLEININVREDFATGKVTVDDEGEREEQEELEAESDDESEEENEVNREQEHKEKKKAIEDTLW